jgi:hypothetical protein
MSVTITNWWYRPWNPCWGVQRLKSHMVFLRHLCETSDRQYRMEKYIKEPIDGRNGTGTPTDCAFAYIILETTMTLG